MEPEATQTKREKVGGVIGEVLFAPLRLIAAALCIGLPLALAKGEGAAFALLVIPTLPAALTCLWMPETGSKLWYWYGRTLRKASLKIPASVRQLGDRAIKSASDAIETSANIFGAVGVRLVGWTLRVALSVLSIGLFAATIYVLFQGIAELPISVAIILGAMIIGWAVAKR
ncbi:hypothetical protein [Thermaurantiacus sp.]